MKNLTSILFLAVTLLVSCNNSREEQAEEAMEETPAAEAPAPAATESGTKVWRLASYGDPASPTPVPSDMEITMEMDLQQNLISGKAACNNYNGNLVSDNGMRVGQLVSTKKACPQPAMDMETMFLNMLQQVNGYQISGGQMIMTTTDGKQLVFNS